MVARAHGMEGHLVVDTFAIDLQYDMEEFLYLLGAMNVELGCSSQQGHCADQTGQSKHMVAMIVADEEVPQTVHVELMAGKLHLGCFSAVYHHQFSARVHYLTGGKMFLGWFCASTSQNMHVKGFHSVFLDFSVKGTRAAFAGLPLWLYPILLASLSFAEKGRSEGTWFLTRRYSAFWPSKLPEHLNRPAWCLQPGSGLRENPLCGQQVCEVHSS